MWIVFLVFIFIDRHTYCAGHSGHMGTFFVFVLYYSLSTVGTWAQSLIFLTYCAGHNGHMGTFIICLFYVLGTVGTWAHSLIYLTYCAGHNGHMGTFII